MMEADDMMKHLSMDGATKDLDDSEDDSEDDSLFSLPTHDDDVLQRGDEDDMDDEELDLGESAGRRAAKKSRKSKRKKKFGQACKDRLHPKTCRHKSVLCGDRFHARSVG